VVRQASGKQYESGKKTADICRKAGARHPTRLCGGYSSVFTIGLYVIRVASGIGLPLFFALLNFRSTRIYIRWILGINGSQTPRSYPSSLQTMRSTFAWRSVHSSH
jgi:hypothetical protein